MGAWRNLFAVNGVGSGTPSRDESGAGAPSYGDGSGAGAPSYRNFLRKDAGLGIEIDPDADPDPDPDKKNLIFFDRFYGITS